MKRIFFSTALILAVVLTSCGTLEVTLEDPSKPTPTLASDSLAADSASLTIASTSEEIRQTLLDSVYRWHTIFMDAQVTSSTNDPRRVQVWVDQPSLSLRVLSGPLDAPAETFRAADGMTLLDLNILTGESNLSPFIGETIQIPYTPAPLDASQESIQPHPLSTATDRAMGILLFPSDIAQNQGTFKVIGMEVIAYRLCLIVEWTYIENELPSYRAWVDVSTGVFMRYQQFEKVGGADILSEVTVTRVDYDLSFNADLFRPAVESMPDFSEDPLIAVSADSLPAEFVETDPLGSVYAFLADNSQPVGMTRWVRLPASCVTGDAACPEAEVIQLPVELTYSLQPVVWSPTRREAAWAYPVNAEGRIWTLYLFSARENLWKELASFDRYMDPPIWSRNGAWLAFRLQDGEGGSEIYVIRRDGTDMRVLTDNDQLPADGAPYVMDSWLGENVVLRSASPGRNGALYLLRVADGNVTPLFETLLTKAPFLESPDGTLLAYVDYEYTSQKQVVKIITPDGNDFRNLATFSSGSIVGLTWSPDGSQLAFAQVSEAMSSVYVIDSDGRNLRQVFINVTGAQFIFSPDGQYLLVQALDGSGERLYAIHLTTLDSHVVQAPGVALNESWLLPSWRK
ncbi:MAG: Protein TolB [Anaerolineales bacterium]|nr:Protein TolB [Anaerolineales bacterium]